MNCRIWIPLLCIVVSATAAPARCEERSALIIGNAKYEGEAALRNPGNDADAMEATLKKLNFKVIKKTDADLDEMEKAVVEFRRSLKRGSVGLFYYAGHGLQVKGENYLVPLKTTVDEEFQVKRRCFAVDQAIEAMNESESFIKVVILDCCRNNPFKRGWARGGPEKGMAAISEVPNGTIIAFATAPGTLAADGARGTNSPYTTHLVASLNSRPKGGLELTEALREASRAVKKETGQVPWLNLEASLDKFFLWRDLSTTVKTDTPAPISKSEDWGWAKVSDNPAQIRFVAVAGGKVSDAWDSKKELVVPSFEAGETPVTVGQFRRFVNDAKFKTLAELTDAEAQERTRFIQLCYFKLFPSFGREKFEAAKGAGVIDEKFTYDRRFSWQDTGWKQADYDPAVNLAFSDMCAFCEWMNRRDPKHEYRTPSYNEAQQFIVKKAVPATPKEALLAPEPGLKLFKKWLPKARKADGSSVLGISDSLEYSEELCAAVGSMPCFLHLQSCPAPEYVGLYGFRVVRVKKGAADAKATPPAAEFTK